MPKKGKKNLENLSRRERQIMEVIYRQGEASVRDVLENLSDPSSYSAIRTLIRILEEKGWLSHKSREGRYVYQPKIRPETARISALKRVVETFYENSAEKAFNALISAKELDVSDTELDRLADAIEAARQARKNSRPKK